MRNWTLAHPMALRTAGLFLVCVQGGALWGRAGARLSARRCALRFPSVQPDRGGHFVVGLSH